MSEVIRRNYEAAQYVCAARKNFIQEDVISESDSKILIGHISDIHSDIKRFDNALELFDYFNPEFVIHTGDCVKWDTRDEFKFLFEKTKDKKYKFFNCIGNHDTFAGEDSLSVEWTHDNLVKPLKDIKGDNGRGYYYSDFEDYNLRLIVLNNYEYYEDGLHFSIRDKYYITKKQSEWLINLLKDASEKEIGVIIASHETDEKVPYGANDFGFCQRFVPAPWGKAKQNPTIIADIVDAFKHGKHLKQTYDFELVEKAVEIDVNFDKCGEFICYLTGHRHSDIVGYLPSYPDQLAICMTCSGCQPEGYHNIGEEISDLPRIPDTVSEDAINFYTIDRKNKEVAIVRVGACVTDNFKLRRAVKLKY